MINGHQWSSMQSYSFIWIIERTNQWNSFMNPCNQNEEKCKKNQNRFETLRLVFRVIAVMQALCLPQNLRRSFLLTFLSIRSVRYSFCVDKSSATGVVPRLNYLSLYTTRHKLKQLFILMLILLCVWFHHSTLSFCSFFTQFVVAN